MSGYRFFVDDEGLARMNDTAMRVLAELGVRTDHPDMRERLAGLGCTVVGETVRIPPHVVEGALATTPHSFAAHGRDPAQCLVVGEPGHTYCTNTGIVPNIVDFDTGEIRRSTLRDVELTTRLLDALTNVDIIYVSLVDATEMPPELVTLHDFAAVLRNTTKPLIGPGITSGAEAEAVVAMAAAVRGGREQLAAAPLSAPFICPITPLHFPSHIVDALCVVAEAGLPLDIVTNPVMGVTAPYSLSGTVMLGHAEVLATIVMAQAVRPGLPVLNQNTPSIADMRTLGSTTGGPETGLIRRTAIELSGFVNIPAGAHGHTSSARIDIQAADEKTLNTLLIASARPALLGGMGGMSNVTLTAYETLALDDERFGAVRRVLQGVAYDDDSLGFDVISDLVAGGDIIGHEHTLARLRSGETWRPALAVRQGLVNGQPPAATMLDRARTAVRKMMETHRVAPLAASVQANIDAILAEYEAKRVAKENVR